MLRSSLLVLALAGCVPMAPPDAVVATALNGQFVPVGSRTNARLAEGDRLEVLAPMQGG